MKGRGNMYMAREKWRVLTDIWLAAFKSPTDLEIPCDTEAEAKTLRYNLYACVRRARKGRFADPFLIDRAEQLAITQKSTTIIIYKRKLAPSIAKLKKKVLDKGVEVSLMRLEELIGKEDKEEQEHPADDIVDAVQYTKHPYFKREKE